MAAAMRSGAAVRVSETPPKVACRTVFRCMHPRARHNSGIQLAPKAALTHELSVKVLVRVVGTECRPLWPLATRPAELAVAI